MQSPEGDSAARIGYKPSVGPTTAQVARPVAGSLARALGPLLLSACAYSGAISPVGLTPGGRSFLGVPYAGRGSSPHQRLDVFVPPGAGRHPVILFVHGGNWDSGDTRGPFDAYRRVGLRFAARGVLFVNVSYRLAPEVRHPTQVEDVARAIVSVRRNVARIGGDPRKIVLVGHSAGAQLALLCALDARYLAAHGEHPARLHAVVGISGPYDVAALARHDDELEYVVRAFGPRPARWSDASPATHAGRSATPPLLLAIGHDDYPFLQRATVDFRARLENAGIRPTVIDAPDRDHYGIVTQLGLAEDRLTAAILGLLR